MFQLAVGGVLILIVAVVEFVAVTPKGIYSHTTESLGRFEINDDKPGVLAEINRRRGIRELATCRPDRSWKLTSRKGFAMTEALAESNLWRCVDRKKGLYLFGFKKAGGHDRLARIIHLNDLPDPDQPFDLFTRCPETGTGLDRILEDQARYPVYYR